MKKLNVKFVIALLFFLTISSSVMAVVEILFTDWDSIIRGSPDILVVKCTRTPNPEDYAELLGLSDIEVVSILKGSTNWGTEPLKAPCLGAARMRSTYFPRQGEYYLIFSIYDYGEYQATEKYRVVPLGLTFYTNSLSGQTLNEQVQTLFKLRIGQLNKEIQKDQEEKARLEEGLQK